MPESQKSYPVFNFMISKRIFDFFFSFFILIILSPVLLFVSMMIIISDGSNPFFIQERVGKKGNIFRLIKFRTMKKADGINGLPITVGTRDPRITKIGYVLRKHKIDEYPQLLNILMGQMSFVGPRPEVKKYVEMYSEEQRKILNVRPGLTSYASLIYFDENRMLSEEEDPEKVYIEKIMPGKIELDLKYIDEMSFSTDLKILCLTGRKIISGHTPTLVK
jgi:lipopolysaccharide/colanic/teichoic acid biosynthesis glycosyltransferase